jgi:hypothetical protein
MGLDLLTPRGAAGSLRPPRLDLGDDRKHAEGDATPAALWGQRCRS